MRNVFVSTSEYAFSHGKLPRGKGYWAFFFGNKRDLDEVFWFNGSYGEAVKAAKAEAVRRGASYVEVGS